VRKTPKMFEISKINFNPNRRIKWN
jgi:hypothetical protein